MTDKRVTVFLAVSLPVTVACTLLCGRICAYDAVRRNYLHLCFAAPVLVMSTFISHRNAKALSTALAVRALEEETWIKERKEAA